MQCLYNNVLWHLNGDVMAMAYIQHMFVPQMLATPIGGIPNITGMTLHFDSATTEWYVSSEGSNFLALYTAPTGLCIDRRRCFTTNVLEILSCLGLEAVCAMFTNGGRRSLHRPKWPTVPTWRALWA
jgi:hypothetical protein